MRLHPVAVIQAQVPFIRYYGSKCHLAEWIIDQFPNRSSVHVEPYAGGACLLQHYKRLATTLMERISIY